MIEVYLFIIVGAVIVTAATMMLLSENAVHSALFLILNFAGVAFLYLMLEAPFLAMVQIAVYAGAIMVLFLFVIMLLGAERSESQRGEMQQLKGSGWHAPIALVLALVLLFAMGLAIGNGQVNVLERAGEPVLRVAHYAEAASIVDVEVDGQVVATDLAFREVTAFQTLYAGDHDLVVKAAETDEIIYEGIITLEQTEAGYVTTAIVTGDETVVVNKVFENVSAPPERSARVTVFNAFTEAISIQDRGGFGIEGDGEVLLSNLAPGESGEIVLPEGLYDSLRVVRPSDEENDAESVSAFFSIRDRDLERDTANLMVVSSLEGSEFASVGFTVTDTASSFGSPKAVGQVLFTRYLLPLQMVGLLLLAALVGVIVIAQRQVSPSASRQSAARKPVRRRVSRPLVSVIANQVTTDDGDSPQLSSGD